MFFAGAIVGMTAAGMDKGAKGRRTVALCSLAMIGASFIVLTNDDWLAGTFVAASAPSWFERNNGLLTVLDLLMGAVSLPWFWRTKTSS